MIIKGFPAAYVGIYDMLKGVAVKHGYALAIHGSLMRDMDLIAVPWTEDADAAEVLIKAMTEAVGLVADKPFNVLHPTDEACDGVKPHGRLAWNIMLGSNAYIDISVMPRSNHE